MNSRKDRFLVMERREAMRRFLQRLFGVIVVGGLFVVFPFLDSGEHFAAIGSFASRIPAVAQAGEVQESGSITKLKVEPLYRAVRLTWRARIDDKGPLTFEIYRSMASPDGPYTLVTSIEKRPGVKKYKYIDKRLQVEENYFYKIVIPETKENFGPLQVRPPFSLPTT